MSARKSQPTAWPYRAGLQSNAPLLWLMLAASSTLAGNISLVGSVANIIVAQGAKDEAPLRFSAFFKVGAPSAAVTIFVSAVAIWAYARLGWV